MKVLTPRLFHFAALASLVIASALAESLPPLELPPRLLPPPGIALPADTVKALTQGLENLEKLADEQKNHPLIPDVQIYLKAVRFALEFGEFYKPGNEKIAHEALLTAEKRLEELKTGQLSWIGKPGLHIRGFRSKIDGSPQPYGVEIPEGFDFSKSPKCYLWLHGRGDTETDLYFIANREKKKSEFTPPTDTIVIHPFGRHCNGYKGPGEIDVIEALGHATNQYKIDPDRVALMGFSMGGAGAWHLGAHYPNLWCIVHPGAGFVDVQRYTKTDPASVPSWERTLWNLYDVPSYARNFLNIPLVVYSGEKDKQKAAADIMEAELATHGLKMQHFVGPGVEHKYEPETKKKVQAVIDAALVKGRIKEPREIHFQTRTLRYRHYSWLTVEDLAKPWEDSRVDAIWDGQTIKATTLNITRVRFDLPTALSVEINGQTVQAPQGRSLILKEGKWIVAEENDATRQYFVNGPMDEIITKPFYIVEPTKASAYPLADRWVKFEMTRFERQWRSLYRGTLRRLSEKEIPIMTRALSRNLILWGDPTSNPMIASLEKQMPFQWQNGQITGQGQTWDPFSFIPRFSFTIRGSHLFTVNNGCSFYEGHGKTNALQNPKLPDWAIIDLRQAPDATSSGKIDAAGFYEDMWRPRPSAK